MIKFKARREYHSSLPFVDLLFNTLVGFFFLFAIAVLLINIQTKKADIRTKAEYVITLTWEDDRDEDVDMWLEDPIGNKLFFRNKETPMAHLDRDDRGGVTDSYTLGDGRVIRYEYNQEIGTIRGFISGEWTLNIHLYRRGAGKDDVTPLKVKILMQKLNPSVKTVLEREIVLTKYWEEVTVKRFTMRADGVITEWSELYRKVIVEDGRGGISQNEQNFRAPGSTYRTVDSTTPTSNFPPEI